MIKLSKEFVSIDLEIKNNQTKNTAKKASIKYNIRPIIFLVILILLVL